MTDHTGAVRGASIFRQLQADWDRLCADPAAARIARGWGPVEPALAGLAALEELPARVVADRDPVLLALLRRAVGGGVDAELAARAVLQLMLPKAAALARRYSTMWGYDEAAAIAVSALYEAIRTYPVERRPAAAANLAAETWRRFWPAVSRTSRTHEHETSSTLLEGGALVAAAPAPPRPDTIVDPIAAADERGAGSDEQMLLLLAWLMAAGGLDADTARLIARDYAHEVPAWSRGHLEALADDTGLSRAAVRQRLSRGRRQVVAVAGDLVAA